MTCSEHSSTHVGKKLNTNYNLLYDMEGITQKAANSQYNTRNTKCQKKNN